MQAISARQPDRDISGFGNIARGLLRSVTRMMVGQRNMSVSRTSRSGRIGRHLGFAGGLMIWRPRSAAAALARSGTNSSPRTTTPSSKSRRTSFYNRGLVLDEREEGHQGRQRRNSRKSTASIRRSTWARKSLLMLWPTRPVNGGRLTTPPSGSAPALCRASIRARRTPPTRSDLIAALCTTTRSPTLRRDQAPYREG